jgi:hypothetical protein
VRRLRKAREREKAEEGWEREKAGKGLGDGEG